MDITGKIEEVNQSDSLLLVVFYADWSPHCEWIEPLLHEFEKPVNIVRVNIESNRKVADAYEIEIAPSFVLQRKGKMLWEKTGEVFPGELRDHEKVFGKLWLHSRCRYDGGSDRYCERDCLGTFGDHDSEPV